jgi:hypothetical protein
MSENENVDRNSKRKIFEFVTCLLQATLTYHRLCRKAVFIIWSECCHLPNSPNPVNSAGILEQSMGARNREEIGLLYRPARLHIGWRNRSLESIPGLLKSLQIRALYFAYDVSVGWGGGGGGYKN